MFEIAESLGLIIFYFSGLILNLLSFIKKVKYKQRSANLEFEDEEIVI